MGLIIARIITFKPLSRKRYRCNQTGQIVKQGHIETYRRTQANNLSGGKQ